MGPALRGAAVIQGGQRRPPLQGRTRTAQNGTSGTPSPTHSVIARSEATRQSVLPCPKRRIPTPVTRSLARNDSAPRWERRDTWVPPYGEYGDNPSVTAARGFFEILVAVYAVMCYIYNTLCPHRQLEVIAMRRYLRLQLILSLVLLLCILLSDFGILFASSNKTARILVHISAVILVASTVIQLRSKK